MEPLNDVRNGENAIKYVYVGAWRYGFTDKNY